jgi:solute carrier family 35 protein E3
MQLEHALFLAFNFVSSVGVIFINKAIFSAFRFRYTTLLTAIHYVVTLAGLEFLAILGVYERRTSPLTPRLLCLAAVVGTAPALNNLSLSLNNLGFYQVVK